MFFKLSWKIKKLWKKSEELFKSIITLYFNNVFMKLLTKDLIKDFRKIWNQEEIEDPIFICKFFNPCWPWTWYASEYDEENKIFFWYVDLIHKEWGYFSLGELESLHLPYWLKIERDLHFTPCRFSDIKRTF